jgi:hypothetical protein
MEQMEGRGQRKGIIVKGKSGDPESVYDTFVYLNTAAAQQLLFQTFAGKTLDLTNMTDSGKLPTGKSLVCSEFNIYLYMPASLNNAKMLKLYDFLARTTVEVVKENRAPSFTKTLQMLFGLTSRAQLVPTTAGDNVSGFPAPFFRGKMKIYTRALDLGANQTFFVRQTTFAALDADLNTLQVRYEFNGLMSKKITE